MRDISDFSDEELRNLIHNHERLGKTKEPRYGQALEESQRRTAPSLSIDRTIAAIMSAARDQRFLSYGEVAAANGLDWSFALHRLMPKHLDLVLAKSNAQGRPLITAIVVNQSNVETGDLESSSLSGFTAGAKRLGYRIDNPKSFLQDQQRQTFEFAAKNQTV